MGEAFGSECRYLFIYQFLIGSQSSLEIANRQLELATSAMLLSFLSRSGFDRNLVR